MKHPVLLPLACLLLVLPACGRRTPPPAGGPTAPLAVPRQGSGSPQTRPPASVQTSEIGTGAPVVPPPAPPPALVPTPQQRTDMDRAVKAAMAAMQEAQKANAAAYAKEMADRQARHQAALADYRAKQEAQAVATKDRMAKARAEWEAQAVGWKAILADPKASTNDKMNAKAALDAGCTLQMDAPTASPPPSEPDMPPSTPAGGDVRATADCDQLIYRFRQAMEARDHAKALQVMQAITALAPKVSPALMAAYVAEANRYLGGPGVVHGPPQGIVPGGAVDTSPVPELVGQNGSVGPGGLPVP